MTLEEIKRNAPSGATHTYNRMFLKAGLNDSWLYFDFEYKDWSPYPSYMPTIGIRAIDEY